MVVLKKDLSFTIKYCPTRLFSILLFEIITDMLPHV